MATSAYSGSNDLEEYKKLVLKEAIKGKEAAGSKWCETEFEDALRRLHLWGAYQESVALRDEYSEGDVVRLRGFTIIGVKHYTGTSSRSFWRFNSNDRSASGTWDEMMAFFKGYYPKMQKKDTILIARQWGNKPLIEF